ncbi:hypothetical protein PR202_gb10289 [Eleusine coracana subsp. coracana]|uniref:Uncharacterized protein n=1 Tax=Eleusine coracana subsp. coracana TaxID=191504 RepID=A0AAV5EJR9_ELECO|nr:hypothetical protein PR202_gb10289 [Eleusine coracana subsp. coracana]
MDAEMKDADTQAEIEWDGGGGADAVLDLTGDGTLMSLCYHQAYGPHDDILLLEATDDLLPNLLQGRSAFYSLKFVVFLKPDITVL